MLENIFQTSILLGIFFIMVIHAHGNIHPPYYMKVILVAGVFVSILIAMGTGIALIWVE